MTAVLAWVFGFMACVCAAAVVGGFAAALLNAYHLRQDLRQRDADILARLRPTVDRSPSGPVADAEAP